MNKEELHLVVLWNNARYKEDEILDDIQKNLEIIECIEIEWTRKNVSSNFTRFYGVKLNKGSHKEKECGTGKFLVVTVVDRNPVYGFVETSRGNEFVNTNMFSLKEKYRKWTKGGHKIHTTNTISETNHDICLLLGINYDDYIASAPKIMEGEYKKRSIKRDLTGCDGWKSLDELFYTLNATINYAVLRNYEILPQKFKSDLHGDIDIITDNYQNMCYIVNAKPVTKNPKRVYNYTIVNDEKVVFDFRHIGDDYYCKDFEKDILNSRVLNGNKIYVPNEEYQFYSLIYHAIIQKFMIAPDYYEKIFKLFCKLELDNVYNINNYSSPFDLYFILLKNFMQKKNYNFVRPEDTTVFYNEKLLDVDEHKEWLAKIYSIENVECYQISQNSGIKCCYYKGNLDGNGVFIKYGGVGEICKNEYKMMQKVYEQNKVNFAKPYYYKCDGNIKNIVMEFLEGDNLGDLIEQNKLSENQKETIVRELEDIAKSLLNIGIVHRDIRPQNLILAKDGHLKLIDFQFAVEYKHYREDKYIKRKPKLIKHLGDEFAPDDMYTWDDFYSISKILKLLDKKSEYIDKNINKYVIKFFNKKFFLNKIFSIRKSNSKEGKIKIITILGLKIIVKRR